MQLCGLTVADWHAHTAANAIPALRVDRGPARWTCLGSDGAIPGVQGVTDSGSVASGSGQMAGQNSMDGQIDEADEQLHDAVL